MNSQPDERVSRMEPLLLPVGSPRREQLFELVLELQQAVTRLESGLPVQVLKSIAKLVRAMNCYYSNLIEGHNTHPIDIERALNGDYSADKKKRDLQLEAKAHIAVQEWLDEGGLKGRVISPESILEIHRRFCENLPAELLAVRGIDGTQVAVTPGQFREQNVKIGNLNAVRPESIEAFVDRFCQGYSTVARSEAILHSGAMHHRLLWIHPFLDGNGRVARLLSHAVLAAQSGSIGVWSIARGLARNEREYKMHLMACDEQRRNEYDGRGNLSESAMAEFNRFFLSVCIDQVQFMQSLIQPEHLRERLSDWCRKEAEHGSLPASSRLILDEILLRGELNRGSVPKLLGVSDRQARRVVAALMDRGVVVSDSHKAPLVLALPATLAHKLMPGLFPEL